MSMPSSSSFPFSPLSAILIQAKRSRKGRTVLGAKRQKSETSVIRIGNIVTVQHARRPISTRKFMPYWLPNQIAGHSSFIAADVGDSHSY